MQILPASENAEGIWQELHGWPLAYKKNNTSTCFVSFEKQQPQHKLDGLEVICFFERDF